MRGVRGMVAGMCVALALPTAAWAGSCPSSTARTDYALADSVFDGVVTSSPATAGLPGDPVTFSVRAWHKTAHGDTPADVSVTVPRHVRFRAGEIWRVFAHQAPDGRWLTGDCSGTARLERLTEPVPFQGPGAGFTGALAAATAGLGVRRRLRRR